MRSTALAQPRYIQFDKKEKRTTPLLIIRICIKSYINECALPKLDCRPMWLAFPRLRHAVSMYTKRCNPGGIGDFDICSGVQIPEKVRP